jgi:hypothetical protein
MDLATIATRSQQRHLVSLVYLQMLYLDLILLLPARSDSKSSNGTFSFLSINPVSDDVLEDVNGIQDDPLNRATLAHAYQGKSPFPPFFKFTMFLSPTDL